MGYSGRIVVARTGAAFTGGAAPVLWEQERGGGWRWIQFDGESAGILSELVSATGQPAISAMVMDSDVAEVEASTPAGQRWRVYLHPEVAAEFDAPPLPRTPDGLLEWAAAAGLSADAAAVREALDGHETMVEDLFDDLVTALGVPEA